MDNRPWIDDGGHYTYTPMLGYNAFINIIIGARDIGKTFTRRMDCIGENLKRGYSYVELVRHQSELEGSDAMQFGYFDKLARFFPDHVFKVEGKHGFIADKADMEDGKVPGSKWRHLVYFVAVSEYQKLKTRTFVNIRDIVFDEFTLEKVGYQRYLKNEVHMFFQVLKTLDRENPDGSHLPLRVWLIGNACDLTCPYLYAFGIRTAPKFGYRWMDEDKTVLLHYVPPFERKKANMSRTDKLISRFDESDGMTFDNEFLNGGDSFIEKKPSSAKFQYAIRLFGDDFGIWYDMRTTYVYVNRKIPPNTPYTFALTMSDMENDYSMIKKTSAYGRQISELAMAGRVRYDSPATRERFTQLLGFLGVK